ncbi:MAG: hypothetical protein PHU06_04635 [Gallionella sp.]|nr:hypothetical protein [Gallionella sp.]MDD4960256.1 hypothetical protein [Gallionella sp.]
MGKYTIGKVGGNVTINEAGGNLNQAGRDVVQGNAFLGFQQDADKAQFLAALDNLRLQLRTVQSEVATSDTQNDDAKDDLSVELLKQIKALKSLSEQAAALPSAQAATPQHTSSVSDCLSTTSKLLDQAKDFGEKAADISRKLAPVITPLAALFGVIL